MCRFPRSAVVCLLQAPENDLIEAKDSVLLLDGSSTVGTILAAAVEPVEPVSTAAVYMLAPLNTVWYTYTQMSGMLCACSVGWRLVVGRWSLVF